MQVRASTAAATALAAAVAAAMAAGCVGQIFDGAPPDADLADLADRADLGVDDAAPAPAADLARPADAARGDLRPADAAPADLARPAADLARPPDAAPSSLPSGTSTRAYTVAGRARSVLVYAPAAAATRPLPLVIALHGNGDTNANFVAALALKQRADAAPFVLAAPQGVRQSFTFAGQTLSGIDWDAYRSAAEGNIDLPLLDALRDDLVATGAVDARRVVVFGYSQGGYLSFRHGMDAAARLACAAVAAAGNPLPGSPLVAQAARRIPVALQIGANDSAVGNARATRDELQARGHPVQYNEIAGAGHVPFPGDPGVPLAFCGMQSL